MIRRLSTLIGGGKRIREFEEIPGPKPLPVIGNLWRYLPIIGEYSLERMDENGKLNLCRYGRIVREVISSKHRIVHLFDPKDIESLFQQEGEYPCRRSHRALIKYRKERPEQYRSGGIFPENGAEWARLRNQFKRHFLVSQNIAIYDEKLSAIASDLAQLVKIERESEGEVKDFQQLLYRWALESIGMVMLDSRIGCLRPQLQRDASRLIKAAHETNYMVMRTELYPGWEQKPNHDYRRLATAQDVMAEVVDKYLESRIQTLPENCEPTLLNHFLSDPQIDRKDLFGLILDFVLAGIDTTSISTGFTLYYLAKHSAIQERVREEITSVIGDGPIRAKHFRSTPLLKACVKESMRLRPVSVGVGRLTTSEIDIHGYRIPNNTMIVTQNQVACQLEENFARADEFLPERWLHRQRQTQSPFLWLPFGHGTRMCLGRRIAELEIYIALSVLLKHFRIEYHYEDIGTRSELINVPDRPMRFRFIDRSVGL